jgi:GT2 family glycosyltransferase
MNECPIFLSIVIVTYNTRNITLQCIESILASQIDQNYEIIVVDNNSSDDTLDFIRLQYPMVKNIRLSKNYGFSFANNVGFKCSSGQYVFFLNSDTIIFRDTLKKLCESLLINQFNVAAPKLLNSDLTLQKSVFYFPNHLKLFLRISGLFQPLLFLKNLLYNKEENGAYAISDPNNLKFDYVSFAAIVVKNEVFRELGMLDENILFYHEDCEFGYRLYNRSLKIEYLSEVSLIHLGGSSTNSFSEFAFENDIVSLLYVFEKHRGVSSKIVLKFVLILAIIIRTLLTIVKLHNGFERLIVYKNLNVDYKIKVSSFLKFQIRLIKRIIHI